MGRFTDKAPKPDRAKKGKLGNAKPIPKEIEGLPTVYTILFGGKLGDDLERLNDSFMWGSDYDNGE